MNAEWKWNDDDEPAPPSASHFHGWDGEKFPGGWPGSESFFAQAQRLDYFTLRQRSHELFETNLYGRGIIRRLVTNEVHTGLALSADPTSSILDRSEDDLEAWGGQVEALFTAWSKRPEICSYEQHQDQTFGELTALHRREALVGGDCLIVLRPHPKTKRPTVQVIGGHLVRDPFPMISTTNTIEHGVEIDKRGRQVAYHVHQEGSLESTRIAARTRNGRKVAWLAYGTDRRVGQVRGAPLLGVILQSIAEIDRYRDSTQRKALINSLFAMWIEKTQDKVGTLPIQGAAVRAGVVNDVDHSGRPREWNVVDQIPGMVVEELNHGEKPHAFKADGGDTVQFPDFEAAIISACAWALQIPPEILRLSFDANYAASQASLNEFKLYLAVERGRIAQSFNQPVYEEWLSDTVNLGIVSAPGLIEATRDAALYETLEAWTHADWIGSVKPVMDTLKMVRAFEIMVDRAWTTDERVSRELTGTKFSTNVRKLSKAMAEMPVREESAAAGLDRENALLVDALLDD